METVTRMMMSWIFRKMWRLACKWILSIRRCWKRNYLSWKSSSKRINSNRWTTNIWAVVNWNWVFMLLDCMSYCITHLKPTVSPQKEISAQLSGPSTSSSSAQGLPSQKLFLGYFMKPYFKDKLTSLVCDESNTGNLFCFFCVREIMHFSVVIDFLLPEVIYYFYLPPGPSIKSRNKRKAESRYQTDWWAENKKMYVLRHCACFLLLEYFFMNK